MDLLDFDPGELYYQQEDSDEVNALIKQAGNSYEDGEAELPLLQAYLRSPTSLNVLVAINRFYYYQHRLPDALVVSEKALEIIREKLQFPADWQSLEIDDINNVPTEQLSWVRLYLFTLKSIGFLKLRMHELEPSKTIFEKLSRLDSENRIGAKALLELATRTIEESNNIFQLYK